MTTTVGDGELVEGEVVVGGTVVHENLVESVLEVSNLPKTILLILIGLIGCGVHTGIYQMDIDAKASEFLVGRHQRGD